MVEPARIRPAKPFQALPSELQLEVFKKVKFDQLISIKKLSFDFNNFINIFKNKLPRERFERITFWLTALEKGIHVFNLIVDVNPTDRIDHLIVFNEGSRQMKRFILKLPKPETIQALKFIRYWIVKMIESVFLHIELLYFIFNIEMIKLLFDDDEIAKFKFICQKADITYHRNIDLKFALDSLIISEHLMISFNNDNITEEDKTILFDLLLKEGDRIPKVIFNGFNNAQFYNDFTEILETSNDLSKLVPRIVFECNFLESQLIVRGVQIMEESNDEEDYYRFTNNHDPQIIFQIVWNFKNNGNLTNEEEEQGDDVQINEDEQGNFVEEDEQEQGDDVECIEEDDDEQSDDLQITDEEDEQEEDEIDEYVQYIEINKI